jgi:hypothetical protein
VECVLIQRPIASERKVSSITETWTIRVFISIRNRNATKMRHIKVPVPPLPKQQGLVAANEQTIAAAKAVIAAAPSKKTGDHSKLFIAHSGGRHASHRIIGRNRPKPANPFAIA